MAGNAREFSAIKRVLRTGGCLGVASFLLLIGSEALQNAVAEGDTRTLSFHHLHTDENITITYKINGRYDEAALKKLNWFMRDWRKQEQTTMDPHLFDLIWEAYREVGGKEPIEVVCGYRSPATNAMLRARSSGVAQFSQHTHGQAMDFYIPGVPLDQLRNVGLRLQRGGVGFYPTSGSPFVHLDTGSIRHWPRMTHDQLAKVFPNGRTVHVPSDGRPLAGYALALADVEKRGSAPSGMSLAAARDAGVINGDHQSKAKSFFASLFGFGNNHQAQSQEADENETTASVTPASARAKPGTIPVKTVKIEQAAAQVPLPHARPAPVAVAAATPAPAAAVPQKTFALASAESVPAPAPKAAGGDVISSRGYWGGSVDPVPARPQPAPGHAASRAFNDPIVSASLGSDTDDRAAANTALAYAAPAARAPAARATPMGSSIPRMPAASLREPPADSSAIVKQTAAPSGEPVRAAAGQRYDQVWLRALILSPSARHFMTTTRLGATDMRTLTAQFIKPASSVVMGFSADPHLGMTADNFSGSAVVFLATATFSGNRTASLR